MLNSLSPVARSANKLCALLLASLVSATVTAEKETEPELNEETILAEFIDEDTVTKCIYLRRVDRTEVLSNQSIVFHMQGRKAYVNRLRYRCPGLSRHDTIMFETRSSRLCHLDQVTVLDDIGGRFMRGARCGLGSFYEIDEETIDLLKGNIEQRRHGKRGKGRVE